MQGEYARMMLGPFHRVSANIHSSTSLSHPHFSHLLLLLVIRCDKSLLVASFACFARPAYASASIMARTACWGLTWTQMLATYTSGWSKQNQQIDLNVAGRENKWPQYTTWCLSKPRFILVCHGKLSKVLAVEGKWASKGKTWEAAKSPSQDSLKDYRSL